MNHVNRMQTGTAKLGSEVDYTLFSFGDRVIRFAAPYSLRQYLRIKRWHNGYLEVVADYGEGPEEDYIDLRPILRNLLINPKSFLRPIKKVEVCHAQEKSPIHRRRRQHDR